MSTGAYSIHIRPWFLAAGTLLPRRSVFKTTAPAHKEKTMNFLGLKISIESPSSRTAWMRRVAAIASLNVVVLASGTAYAMWSATGSGSAAAKSRSAVALTAAAVTPATGDLYPGGVGAVSFTVNNTNPYNVTLSKLTAATVVSDDTTNCPSANIGITPSIATAIAGSGYTLPSSIVVSAGGTTATQTLAGLLTMAATAPDGCQGKTFTATLTFTGTQS